MIHEQDLGQSNVDWIDREKALAEFPKITTTGAPVENAKADEQKGDVSGHAFHGNRFTGGIGGGHEEQGDPGSFMVKPSSPEFAILRYQSGGYAAINAKLRGVPYDAGGAKELENDYKNAEKYAAKIEAQMKPLEEGRTLYRGLDQHAVEVVTGLPHQEDLSDAEVKARLEKMVGTEFEDKGLVSTSFDQKQAGQRMAYQGSGHVLIALDVPAGVRALNMNQTLPIDHNAFSEEKEILLAPGLHFKVTGVSESTIESARHYENGEWHTKTYTSHVLHVAVVADSKAVASLQLAGDKYVWNITDIVVTKTPEAKGEGAGHAFRGNRFTGGISVGDDEEGAPRMHPVKMTKEEMHAFAQILQKDAAPPKAIGKQEYMELAGKFLMAEQAADQTPYVPPLHPGEEDAAHAAANKFYELEETLGDYETADAWLLNMELRSGVDPSQLSMSNHNVSEMDEAVKMFGNHFDDDKTVFRGSIMDRIPQVGEVYHDPAYVSTIPDAYEAVNCCSAQYAHVVGEMAAPVDGASVVWEINIPAGTDVVAARPNEYKSPDNDVFLEVLLGRGANLRVEATGTRRGVTFVKATYLGSQPKPFTPRARRKSAAQAPAGNGWRILWLPGNMSITTTEPATKGDVAGHEFHGNRFTGGIGGAEHGAPVEVKPGEAIPWGQEWKPDPNRPMTRDARTLPNVDPEYHANLANMNTQGVAAYISRESGGQITPEQARNFMEGWDDPQANVYKAALLRAAETKYGVPLTGGQAVLVRTQLSNSDAWDVNNAKEGANEFLETQYRTQQDYYKEVGTQSVLLARGLSYYDEAQIPERFRNIGFAWERTEVQGGPISSWTINANDATDFALDKYGTAGGRVNIDWTTGRIAGGGTVREPIGYEIAMEVPVERILSDGIHGAGAEQIGEHLVIGQNKPESVWIRRVTPRAPTPIQQMMDEMRKPGGALFTGGKS